MVTMPALDGVEHRYVELGDGVTIHVADAGPADGPAVMLVHGFPQNWWEWHELIGPLANACASPGTRWPVRGGIARFRPGRW